MIDQDAVTALLFDFDGTIADTSSCWVDTAVRCFGARGYDLDEATANRVLVTPWLEVLPDLPATLAREIERDMVHTIHGAYLECPPMDGLADFLDGCPAVPKAIVTSSYRTRLVEPYLRRHDLERFFPVIVGSEDTRALKPSPEPVLLALRSLDAAVGGAWLIGDSATDIEAARAAGIGSVGFGDPAIGGDLAAAGPDELLRLLAGLLAADERRAP